MSQTLTNDSPTSHATFLFAHGAGAAMDSPWMTDMAEGLAARGLRVVRFEFPYMAGRREGMRRPPDRLPTLLKTFRTHYEREIAEGRTVLVGGKSMGGRIASMIADEVSAAGLLCFGYPFKPVGKDEIPDDRILHLRTLKTPARIIQGTRDPFGGPEEVEGLHLSSAITFTWLEDGDHDLKPRVKSGHTAKGHRDAAIAAAMDFVQSVHTR